jgi:hypothetical protein
MSCKWFAKSLVWTFAAKTGRLAQVVASEWLEFGWAVGL